MCVSVGGVGEVDLHDHLELGLIAAVLEGGVVVVAAEHVGLVVREPRAVETEVIAPLVVAVGFTHAEMCRESCSGEQEEDYCQDIEGLAAGDRHLLVLMCEEGGPGGWEGGAVGS